MLMRYAAVALLIAALAASAVRAQTPRREGPASPQPRGEGPEVYKVKPQPDSPLRLSVKTTWLDLKLKTRWTDPSLYELTTRVENVSDRDVSAYTVRKTPGVNIPGLCDWHTGRGRVLRPGQSAWQSTPSAYSPSSPVHTYEVDFVEFADGTTWGADVCRSAEYRAGERAGAAAAAARLLELLAGAGPDAVMKAVEEELAACLPDAVAKAKVKSGLVGCGFDAVLKEAVKLGLARRGPDGVLKAVEGESGDVAPPREHSPVWKLGFFIGTKEIAYRVGRAVEVSGPGEIEPTLRRPYDAAGEK